jgi:hypothetical protein
MSKNQYQYQYQFQKQKQSLKLIDDKLDSLDFSFGQLAHFLSYLLQLGSREVILIVHV